MKVATRIISATAVVVLIATSIYAAFDLRGRVAERRSTLEREAKALATTLRATFEVTASAFRAPSDAQLEIMSARTGGWHIAVLPRERALDPVPGPNASQGQLKLLQTMTELPTLCDTSPALCANTRGNIYFYALPLRARTGADSPTTVVGMLEISRASDVLSVTTDDLFGALALVALIVVVTTLVVGLVASRFVSRPITKLLSGIDDVAKGDLSHVLLSERDDEIGQIATRFNDMTFSLRESRGETQRQNEAKLALEQRLGQTEKLATIGQLAAEIAHEVGTPLNVIAGRARSIQKKSRDHEAVEKNAEIVAEQTARITRIIQRLLDFTRRKVGTAGKQEINVNELSLLTMELLASQFSSAKVRTRLERAEGLPRVAGDQDRLQQVMINLLLNAVQAMPDGGSLAVETAIVRRTRPGLEDGAEQRFVSFAVRDTGIGVPEDIRDKIFDPFYTTKEGQGGTGLGLAVCSGIVKEHDGWIDIESNTNGGTIFRVFLPA
ncbi:MAG: ATP-binding protein [Deltaproteobacteria bacterium]